MSRRIAVKNVEGGDDTVVAVYGEVEHDPIINQPGGVMGSVDFYLSSTGEPLNLESKSRFVDLDGEVYFVTEDRDREWLSRL